MSGIQKQTCLADPNLVPYRDEWDDDVGCMANAIFWLEKNWTSPLNAQGDKILSNGTRLFWNYSPITKTILVHINGSRECWKIDRDKMLHCKDGLEEMATIYRPFLKFWPAGLVIEDPKNQSGLPNVTWLVTRIVTIRQDHHYTTPPLLLKQAMSNLDHLLKNSPIPKLPTLELNVLLTAVPWKKRTEVPDALNHDQAMAYVRLTQKLKSFKEHTGWLEDKHSVDAKELYRHIKEFNATVEPETDDVSWAAFYEGTLSQMEIDYGSIVIHNAVFLRAMYTEHTFASALDEFSAEKNFRQRQQNES